MTGRARYCGHSHLAEPPKLELGRRSQWIDAASKAHGSGRFRLYYLNFPFAKAAGWDYVHCASACYVGTCCGPPLGAFGNCILFLFFSLEGSRFKLFSSYAAKHCLRWLGIDGHYALRFGFWRYKLQKGAESTKFAREFLYSAYPSWM